MRDMRGSTKVRWSERALGIGTMFNLQCTVRNGTAVGEKRQVNEKPAEKADTGTRPTIS